MASQHETKIPAIPVAGVYRIDTVASAITYTSRHMFGLGKVHAKFTIASGHLEVGEALADSKAMATIAAGSFASNNAKRDSDVKGPALLDVTTFPLIEFTSTGAREDENGIILVGAVAMRGVSAPVQVLVLSWEAYGPDRISVRARADHLDRCLFGITGAKGWVGRYFDLDLDVVAVQAGRN